MIETAAAPPADEDGGLDGAATSAAPDTASLLSAPGNEIWEDWESGERAMAVIGIGGMRCGRSDARQRQLGEAMEVRAACRHAVVSCITSLRLRARLGITG